MNKLTIKISPYAGDLKLIYNIRDLIKKKYSFLFHSVLLHGSIATDEVISYSDFDGLLIVKDQYYNSKKLKKFIRESMKLILVFDPLQHHGWFVIFKSQLNNYPQTYFPYEIFKKTKAIYPDKDIQFKIQLPEIIDYNLPLNRHTKKWL